MKWRCLIGRHRLGALLARRDDNGDRWYTCPDCSREVRFQAELGGSAEHRWRVAQAKEALRAEAEAEQVADALLALERETKREEIAAKIRARYGR
jgi:hypothetical protein